MQNQFLCILSRTGHTACIFKKEKEGLKLIFSKIHPVEVCMAIVEEFNEKGVRIFEENFVRRRIEANRIVVGPGDRRYLRGCVAELNQRGWYAFICTEDRVAIFRKLQEVSVSDDVRLSFSQSLNILSPNGLKELKNILH